MNTASAIRAIFGLQIGIALVLLVQDFSGALPQLGWPGTTAPRLDQPIRPGDQRRRFDPDRLPSPPGVDLPDGMDMPSSLFFEETGANTARISGTIRPGDADRFTDWLGARSEPLLEVALLSPGGSVSDALTIGRRLRQDEIDTRIETNAVCMSACPYMLMGGPERFVSREGAVGVHQHYYGENTLLPAFLAVKDIQSGQAEVMDYLGEMGIDLRLMKHSLATPPDEIYVLVEEELTEYVVATEVTD
ncbi:hypothetical protein RM543_04360 [Roseicyclus sp. F158]|uniref:Periplasmic protein-like protein n=1 Tax=Tropicimonas omnivorans TaxID=3075590 RepID=A0ABU3DDV5_9RHOB|nr:hypothetical protein [Roseicyclus sp. F158]MDT0681908.1 hypothetical protein [Roseicyclus sp. F158]